MTAPVLLAAALLLLPGIPRAHADRALWHFDEDPGFEQVHEGTDEAFSWSVADGTLTATFTGEQAVQRIQYPLDREPWGTGESGAFHVRARFRVLEAGQTSVLFGLFEESDTNATTDDHVCLDIHHTSSLPAGYGGNTYEAGVTEIATGTWYVYELLFDLGLGRFELSLFDDTGEELQSLYATPGSLEDGVDVIAFANDDGVSSSEQQTVELDWVSWALDDTLLPEPPSVQTLPLATEDALDLSVDLHNWSDNSRQVQIDVALYEDEVMDGDHLLLEQSDTAVLPPGESVAWNRAFEGLEVDPWEPDAPALHLLYVAITDLDDGSLLYEEEQTVGFRTFEVDGNRFLLNGSPLYLRGFSWMPPGVLPESLTGDEDYIDEHVQRLVDAGVNFVRLDKGPEAWYDALDRAGILCSAGAWVGGEDSDPTSLLTANRTAVLDLLETYGHHPSIVAWHLATEVAWTTPMQEGMASLADEMALLDPTRPTWVGDGTTYSPAWYDEHDYTGWISGSPHQWADFSDYDALAVPVTFSETVGAYTGQAPATEDNPLAEGFYVNQHALLAGALRHVGHSYDYGDDSLEAQAALTRRILGYTRRARGEDSPIAGAWPYTSAYTWDLDWNESAKPVFDVLAEVYAPIALQVDCPAPHRFAGADLPVDLYVMHDDRTRSEGLDDPTVNLDLLDADGAVLDSWEQSFGSVDYYETAALALDLALPEALSTGEHTLSATLEVSGEELATASCSLFLAEGDWAQVPDAEEPDAEEAGTVAVYDTADGTPTYEALQELGFSAIRLTDPSELTAYRTLVVGRDSLDPALQDRAEEIQDWIEAGGRMLILEQVDEDIVSAIEPWMEVETTVLGGTVEATETSDYVNLERPYLQPLMEDLDRQHFREWNRRDDTSAAWPQHQPYERWLVVPPEDLDHVAILANAGQHLEHALLVEGWVGGSEFWDVTGSWLWSQLDLVDGWEDDPIRARILSNLVRYAASDDEHSLGVDFGCEDRVRFGTDAFESERGVVAAPLLQGLVLMSKDESLGPHVPAGRACTGPLEITDSQGTLVEATSGGTAVCGLAVRADYSLGGGGGIEVKVENTSDETLGFALELDDEPLDPSYAEVEPGEQTVITFTPPGPVPASQDTILEIEVDRGDFFESGQPWFQGLVFHRLTLGDADKSRDQDKDGWSVCGSPTQQPDCDDRNPFVYPTARETCDGVDNDCDGEVDEGLTCDTGGDTGDTGTCADTGTAGDPPPQSRGCFCRASPRFGGAWPASGLLLLLAARRRRSRGSARA